MGQQVGVFTGSPDSGVSGISRALCLEAPRREPGCCLCFLPGTRGVTSQGDSGLAGKSEAAWPQFVGMCFGGIWTAQRCLQPSGRECPLGASRSRLARRQPLSSLLGSVAGGPGVRDVSSTKWALRPRVLVALKGRKGITV